MKKNIFFVCSKKSYISLGAWSELACGRMITLTAGTR